MKITITQLKQIIKEELDKILDEGRKPWTEKPWGDRRKDSESGEKTKFKKRCNDLYNTKNRTPAEEADLKLCRETPGLWEPPEK